MVRSLVWPFTWSLLALLVAVACGGDDAGDGVPANAEAGSDVSTDVASSDAGTELIAPEASPDVEDGHPPFGATVEYGKRVEAFSASKYFTATGSGPQFGDGASAGILIYVPSVAASAQVIWTNARGAVGAGVGWMLELDVSNELVVVYLPSGAWSTGIDVDAAGYHVIALSQDGGTMSLSVDGSEPLTHAMPAYDAADGTSLSRIGIDDVGANPFVGGVLHLVALDRSAAPGELQAWSTSGYDNRFRLPASLELDPRAVFDWRADRDWDGAAATSTSQGSAPVTFDVIGLPTLTQVGEEVTLADTGSWQDNATNANVADTIRHNVFARQRIVTSDTSIAVEIESTIYPYFTTYACVGIYVNGRFVAAPTAKLASSRTTIDVALGAGTNKVVDIVEGVQAAPAGAPLGTFLRSIRTSPGGRAFPPVSAPGRRLVVYGDSIAVGGLADVPVEQSWPMLARVTYPGGVSVEAWGYRSLLDDPTATLAAQLVALARDVVTSGAKSIWLAIGTNDYGLGRQSAADFGARYGALIDAIHALDPSIQIYCQTPILRVAPASESANRFGSTLTDYRTQIATVVSTRAAFSTLVDGTAILAAGASYADGVHPSTAGHATYAAFVRATLGY
jgi:lysophospholipase L1-like esterase